MMNVAGEHTKSDTSHVSLEKLGNRRKTLLFNSTHGEEFLNRLDYCTNILLRNQDGQHIETFLDHTYDLEESWRDIVTEPLSDELVCQQNALWEFIKSEKTYQNILHIVIRLFMSLFNALQVEGDLHEINESDIFGNIRELYRVNRELWVNYIYPVLNQCREEKRRIKATDLFTSKDNTKLQFKDMFSCYNEYCLHENTYLKYVQALTESELITDTDLTKNLRQWMKWCEALPQCQSFKLIGLLSEPRTRLSKYLQLFTTTLNETKEQYEIDLIKGVLNDCKEFEENIDEQIQQRVQENRFQSCLQRFEKETELEEIEIEDEEIKCHCGSVTEFLTLPLKQMDTNRCAVNKNLPTQRYILNESNMKLICGRRKEKITAFIFSDVLILGKLNQETRKTKIISKIYYLDRLNVLKSQVSKNVIVLLYLDEFGLLAETFSFEMQPGKIDAWVSLVQRAKLCYENFLTGKGTVFDFYKKGNSNLQLFPYKKGKLRNRYESGARSAVVSEIIFEDDFMEINNQNKRKLSVASQNQPQFVDIDEVKNDGKPVNENCVVRPHSLGCTNELYDMPLSLSIVCVRQHNDENQSTVIHYETNDCEQIPIFDKTIDRYTQTDDCLSLIT